MSLKKYNIFGDKENIQALFEMKALKLNQSSFKKQFDEVLFMIKKKYSSQSYFMIISQHFWLDFLKIIFYAFNKNWNFESCLGHDYQIGLEHFSQNK